MDECETHCWHAFGQRDLGKPHGPNVVLAPDAPPRRESLTRCCDCGVIESMLRSERFTLADVIPGTVELPPAPGEPQKA